MHECEAVGLLRAAVTGRVPLLAVRSSRDPTRLSQEDGEEAKESPTLVPAGTGEQPLPNPPGPSPLSLQNKRLPLKQGTHQSQPEGMGAVPMQPGKGFTTLACRNWQKDVKTKFLK